MVISENLVDSSAQYTTQRFTFDYVYDQDSLQSEVYANTARGAVLSTLQGYNATVLAYGQTGSGKTYTMEGYDNNQLRGIIPRSVEEIFDHIQNRAHSSVRFLVRASYLQIYNEGTCVHLRVWVCVCDALTSGCGGRRGFVIQPCE